MDDSDTELHAACRRGDHATVGRILSPQNPAIQNIIAAINKPNRTYQRTPLHEAAASGVVECVNKLLNVPGNTSLIIS